MKRTNKMFAVLVGMLLISFAVPALAQAEQCSPDGKICLVTDVSQATNPGQPLQLRVASEASQIIVPQAASGGLVEQGPAGGMSLWEVILSPTAYDQTVSMGVRAFASSSEYEATFQVPVLAAATNYSAVIRRTKKRVTAIYQFDARTTIEATLELNLNSFDSNDVILYTKRVTRTVGPGHQVIKVVLSRNLINRKCRSHGACSVLAVGISSSDDYVIDSSFDRKRLTIHRGKPKPKTK